MESQTIVITYSAEVARLLIENEVDLLRELQKLGLDVTRGARPLELASRASSDDVGLKSIELVILASAVAAPIVASAIARIIDALARSKRAQVNTTTASSSSHSIKLSFLGLSVELTDKHGD